MDNGPDNCTTSPRTLPGGWIGVRVTAWQDGNFCGTSGYSYSSGSQSNWQYWVNQCANPAGLQNFQSRADITMYTGGAYVNATGVFSPIEAY